MGCRMAAARALAKDTSQGSGGKENALRFPGRCCVGSGGQEQPDRQRSASDLEGEKRPPFGGRALAGGFEPRPAG